MPKILLAGGNDHRHAGDLRIHDSAHPVPETSSGMQVHESGLPGSLCITVRNGNGRGFLETPDVPDIRRGYQRIN
jgi:hypothetical protein